MDHKVQGLPLEGYTVLDLTRARAGPTAARQLADFGADVIKIEMPGDPQYADMGTRHGPDFQNLHRNKRSIAINLKEPDGLKIFFKLAESADVVIENYRPQVKYKLGIDYDEIYKVNPKIYQYIVYFTSFNNDSIGSKWVSVFGNHDGHIFQNDQYLPDVDDEGNLNCINCPDSRQEGSIEWYELFNQSVLESPFQDGHFIYVVIPGSGSGDDVVAPRIIIADAENPLQFHKVLDL